MNYRIRERCAESDCLKINKRQREKKKNGESKKEYIERENGREGERK